MLSAYCLLEPAPAGFSLIWVRPFQAKPVSYSPLPVFSGYRTPFLTPVSNLRLPVLSKTRTAINFSLEVDVVNIVVQVGARVMPDEPHHRHCPELVVQRAVRVGIDQRDLVPDFISVSHIVSPLGSQVITVVDDRRIDHLDVRRRLEIDIYSAETLKESLQLKPCSHATALRLSRRVSDGEPRCP